MARTKQIPANKPKVTKNVEPEEEPLEEVEENVEEVEVENIEEVDGNEEGEEENAENGEDVDDKQNSSHNNDRKKRDDIFDKINADEVRKLDRENLSEFNNETLLQVLYLRGVDQQNPTVYHNARKALTELYLPLVPRNRPYHKRSNRGRGGNRFNGNTRREFNSDKHVDGGEDEPNKFTNRNTRRDFNSDRNVDNGEGESNKYVNKRDRETNPNNFNRRDREMNSNNFNRRNVDLNNNSSRVGVKPVSGLRHRNNRDN